MRVIIVSKMNEWLDAVSLSETLQSEAISVLNLQGSYTEHPDFFRQEIENFLEGE